MASSGSAVAMWEGPVTPVFLLWAGTLWQACGAICSQDYVQNKRADDASGTNDEACEELLLGTGQGRRSGENRLLEWQIKGKPTSEQRFCAA